MLDSRLRGNDEENNQKCVIPAKAGIQKIRANRFTLYRLEQKPL
jgi:hypothetical protein